MNSFLQKIIEYVVVFIIGVIIDYYMEIPLEISIVVLMIFGAFSVLIKIDSEKSSIIKKIPVLKDYFKNMETANKKIGQSVQAGSAKDSFKFAVGMFYLLTNYLIVEIFLIAIRYFSYLIQSPPEAFEFHFMEAFSLLFGAGVVSYVVWMKNLTKEVANYKAQKKDKNIGGAIKSKISRMIKLRALFFAYLIWFLGEISFLIYSPAYNEWTTWFVIFGVVYFVVLTCILLFSRIFTHASAHEEKES